ncbi:hypothetical protein [Aridibaculum aurantiacum]|uniref:hypothetical protein n=1 Tax=Aridibaculum aurantiacum TaxID=2810307 RepID=UPI001A9601AE|nr:hypothetical protein [Aridibaculum aurantiacum]
MCSFNISLSSSPSVLIGRARQQIQRHGGTFNGDDTQGEIMIKSPMGTVAGSYHVIGNELQMRITKKPFLVSCSRIEKELRKVLG